MEKLSVEGMTLVPDDPNVSCTIIASLPSPFSGVDSKKIYREDSIITVSAITYPSAGATIPDGPKITSIESSSQYCKDDDSLILLEGDKTATINATPKIPGNPPTEYPISFKVEIELANQDKAEGE